MSADRDRLNIDIEAAPVRLDETSVFPCEEHAECVRFVEHYAVELHVRDGSRPGVFVEPAGVARVEVHTST